MANRPLNTKVGQVEVYVKSPTVSHGTRPQPNVNQPRNR